MLMLSQACSTWCMLLVAATVALANESSTTQSAAAEWIWSAAQRRAGITAYFKKTVNVDRNVTSAVLRGAGESAGLQVYVNGALLADVEPYDPLIECDVTEQIGTGTHVLGVSSTSCTGPAAIFLQLDLTYADKSQESVVTDATWIASTIPPPDWNTSLAPPPAWQPAVSFGAVDRRLIIPSQLGVGITAIDNYEQWREASGAEQATGPASFWLTPGFEVELIRSAGPDEDSWVSLAFDPQGRAVIAKEQRGLLRMTLSEDSRHVIHVEHLAESLEECRGLLFAHGDLFANANNSKALYRLHDDGQDHFQPIQLLYASTGDVGHGRNDIALGPDQRIYMIHGDSVDLPQECIDYTSPYREARRGRKTSEGHLLRIDPNGGTVELLASGLRNPFGIDFNTDGELFTYDADAEYDMGSPWYRPTRVDHLVLGGDYGWRGVTQTWPPYYPDHPDNALPNLDIGKGSPTAVKFGTRSSFPPHYRDALFVLDWAYGRILLVHLVPRGSSYLMEAETFVKGRPLNVTDLDFAPDGSLFLVTGGRATQSALYRIRYVGKNAHAGQYTSSQQADCDEFARQQRRRRHLLESYLPNRVDELALAQVWNDLGDADPWIRHAARNVLEQQPLDVWQERALCESQPTAAAAAIMALARSDSDALRTRILTRLNEFDWSHTTRSNLLAALYSYWLCVQDRSGLDPQLERETTARLSSLYPHRSYAANRLLSELLVSLKSNDVIAKTMRLLKLTNSQTERMHYLHVLRNCNEGWTLDQRREYFEALAGTNQYLGGAGMPDFIRQIRAEAIASLSDAERKALGTTIDITGPPNPPASEPTPARPFVRKWTVEALSASLPDVDPNADLRQGEAMFAAALCIKCHRLAGRGTLIGPDLTSASSRFSRRDLLESIIHPSKVVPDRYRSLQVVTRDGQTYVGQLALGGDYRSPILRLATNPLDPFQATEIPKSEIETQQPSVTSWMPEGLLDTLNRQEVLSLLAYIEAQGHVTK
jgi:putative heme-binding domain-containing protein